MTHQSNYSKSEIQHILLMNNSPFIGINIFFLSFKSNEMKNM